MIRQTLAIPPGRVGLVGYGSLISRASMERTLGRSYDGPVFECLLPHWRRRWDVAMPNNRFFTQEGATRLYPKRILYLNAARQSGCLLNGVLFLVSMEDLVAFDAREWIYGRCDVTDEIADLQVKGGRVYMYAGLPQHLVTDPRSWKEVAVRASYLQILESGLAGQSSDFRERYALSTDEPPRRLVIDDQVDETAPPLTVAAPDKPR
jgi:hypothetical protein